MWQPWCWIRQGFVIRERSETNEQAFGRTNTFPILFTKGRPAALFWKNIQSFLIICWFVVTATTGLQCIATKILLCMSYQPAFFFLRLNATSSLVLVCSFHLDSNVHSFLYFSNSWLGIIIHVYQSFQIQKSISQIPLPMGFSLTGSNSILFNAYMLIVNIWNWRSFHAIMIMPCPFNHSLWWMDEIMQF